MSKRVLYNITSASLQATNISGGTINAATFTGGNLSLSGDLKVAGTLTTVNITSTNLVNTNVSAGVVVASTLLSATGNSNTIGNIFTTGGNLGVGITSPSRKLHVQSDMRIGGSGAVLDFGDDFTTQIFRNATTSEMRFNTNNLSRMTITSTGNLGIGTTAPASQLDVNGSIVCRSSLSAISTSGNVAAFFASDNSVLGWSFGLDTDTSFKIKGGRAGGNQFTNSTFGTTRFTINTGGNVGIACTAPTHLFSVGIAPNGTTKGSISINTSDESRYHLFNYAGVAEWLFGQKSTSRSDFTFSKLVAGTETDYLTISTEGNVGIGTTAPAYKLQVNGGISFPYGNAIYVGDQVYPKAIESVWQNSQDQLVFYTPGANNNTAKLCLQHNGNVGIGTTAPAYTLDVTGSFRLNSTGLQNFVIGNTSGTANHSTYLVSSHGNLEIGIAAAAASFNNSSIAGDVVIRSSKNLMLQSGQFSPNLYIATSGNIGIGTTAPAYKLDVSGTIRASTSITTGALYSTNLTSTNIVATNLSAGTISATTFTGGNLSLSGDLKVAGTLTTVNITSTNLVNTNVSAGVVVASTLLSATGNSNTIGSIFTTGGNVGIGTTSPNSKLHVVGLTSNLGGTIAEFKSSGNAERLQIIDETLSTSLPGGILNATGSFGIGVYARNGPVRFFTTAGNLERMRVTETGNVGIGTTAPAYTLDVNGTLEASNSNGLILFASSGNVGIGTTAPGGILHLNNVALFTSTGNLTCTGDIISFGSLSDIRLKKDVESIDIEKAIDVVSRLRGVTFKWREDVFNENKRNTNDIGFIAQEIEKIIPEAVSEYTEFTSKEVYKNIKHERIIPYLLVTIQYLLDKINK
jgi:hypothetical protein